MNYFSKIQAATKPLIAVLGAKGVEKRHLHFGGPGETASKIYVPTDARSEFLANRAMGDWAEAILADAIRSSCPDFNVVHYGDSDRIAAGDDGFKEFYKARLEDVRLHGKRPDLLVLPSKINCERDISGCPTSSLMQIVGEALFAIEVRSSKFEAVHYMRVREEDRKNGKKAARDTPSFTVKVEDLKIVYRWLEIYDCPQIYCQVFFDSVFAINFLDIFSIIGSGSGFSIDKPAKSQEKATIMIPITSGSKIASVTLPTFTVEHHKTRLGRHDAYVKPVGGTAKLDADVLKKVVWST